MSTELTEEICTRTLNGIWEDLSILFSKKQCTPSQSFGLCWLLSSWRISWDIWDLVQIREISVDEAKLGYNHSLCKAEVVYKRGFRPVHQFYAWEHLWVPFQRLCSPVLGDLCRKMSGEYDTISHSSGRRWATKKHFLGIQRTTNGHFLEIKVAPSLQHCREVFMLLHFLLFQFLRLCCTQHMHSSSSLLFLGSCFKTDRRLTKVI